MPQTMFRVILLPLILLAAAALAACSSEQQPQAEPPAPAATEQAVQQAQQANQAAAEQPQAAAAEAAESEADAEEQPAAEQPQAQSQSDQSAAASAQAEQEQAQPQAEQSSAEADSESGASAESAARSLESVPGIVDPSNRGWPRQVEGLNGIVTIPAKPMRIITASLGHDETTLALIPNDRLIAVGGPSKIATFSNIADLVQDKPEITRDPEVIIDLAPDVVVTSPFFTEDLVDALQRVGIPVIQTALEQDPEARINEILLMGYIYGEEERAFAFADEVRDRYNALIAVTSAKDPKPNVLALTMYTDTIWVAGGGSTIGGVIIAAGGINAAEAAGVDDNQPSSLEGVIAMAPDVMIIAQPLEYGGEEFRQSLLDNELLAEVPAIINGAVYLVDSKFFTTLSFWNIRGAEDLVRILWPADFPDPPAESFSLPE